MLLHYIFNITLYNSIVNKKEFLKILEKRNLISKAL